MLTRPSLKRAYTMQPDDSDDPYRMANDSNAADPNLPQPRTEEQVGRPAPVEAPQPEPRTEEQVGRPAPAEEPRSETPTPQAERPEPEAPKPTFAQMEAEGRARPPAPSAADTLQGMMVAPPAQPIQSEVPPIATDWGGGSGGPDTGVSMVPPSGMITETVENLAPPTATDWGGRGGPDPDGVSLAPPGSMITETMEGLGRGTATDWGGPGSNGPDGGMASAGPPAQSSPRSSDAILSLLTGGAMGTNQTPLGEATNRKLLDQLNASSPYDSQAVRDEYDWLSGNIDDDYAMQTRSLDEGMASRGLYGSSGKDFHSGRLSDLNVGQRSAKVSLAQDLANKYATTKGQYDANAINQAQSGSAQEQADRRAWLSQLMGYGQDAFTNDLASAEFNQRQNESEQDFLLRMLQMGYGV